MSNNNASQVYTGTVDGLLEHCSKLDLNEVEEQMKTIVVTQEEINKATRPNVYRNRKKYTNRLYHVF